MNKAFKTSEGREAVIAYYDMLLKNLTVPYEETTVETCCGSTSVITAGDESNPPIVLLHGSSINATMWVKDISDLAKSYRVYAPDMPGEPGKSCETQQSFETTAYADWLYDVMNGLGIQKAVLAGASLGAWLGAMFAINYGEMVEKLILLCPAGIGSQNHAFKEIAFNLLSKGEMGVNLLFAEINGGVDVPEPILNYNKLISAVFNARQEVIPVFSDEELNKITMPSLLIVGAKDIMLNSKETAERFAKCVPNAKTIMLPDAGHSLYGLSADMMEFIER